MDRLFTSDLLRSGGDIPDGHYAEDSMKRTVVPFRNGIMLAIAAGFAESHDAAGVVIAAHSGDHAIYPAVEVLRPFIAMDKAAIARHGATLGIDFRETWSCYKGADLHCGTCGTCTERREAFQLAGLEDLTDYA